MRIVGWNSQGGGRSKYSHLEALAPDVAVVPEYGKLPLAAPHEVVGENRFVGFGTEGDRGIGVVAGPEWSLAPVDLAPLSGEVLGAVEVRGEAEVNVLAVWACLSGNPKQHPVVEAAAAWTDWIRSAPTVVIGDFNTGHHWTKARGCDAHQPVVDALGALGLSPICCSSHGQDGPTTHWHARSKGRFHIDHAFVSTGVRVQGWGVGLGDTWRSRSDHAPLVLDVEIG